MRTRFGLVLLPLWLFCACDDAPSKQELPEQEQQDLEAGDEDLPEHDSLDQEMLTDTPVEQELSELDSLPDDDDAVDLDTLLDQDEGEDEDSSDFDPSHYRGRCAEVDSFLPMYTDVVQKWAQQDALTRPVEEPLLFVGSSSIRRWEGLSRSYSDYSPLQRGFGGAQLAELAYWFQELIVAPGPRGLVVFAGTNDVAAGVPAEVVLDRFACLRERLGLQLGWDFPLLFIGITPTPSRWQQWPVAAQVNQAVAEWATDDPGLVHVDVPAAFLATGSPPAERLFVGDRLHLSEEGYALWDSILRPAVEAHVQSPVWQPPSAPLRGGERILIDLGPSNPDDGEPSPSPDYLGQHWNNWHPIDGGSELLPGEHLQALRTTQGEPTSVGLVLTGGFSCNGRSNGGLLWPTQDLLGDLAGGSATGDFFYSNND
ncbi:MAG: GDSL-type esterase/lipase family protein, partial [Myxococcota bacterium]|nr:GDSL-type esterase/lipase family protein [Myxococcota bacterium]